MGLSKQDQATLVEILDDLSCRFIINVPDEESASAKRLGFQIEQAHWFYEDFIRVAYPNLPSFPLKTFSDKMLKKWAQQPDKTYAEFIKYRHCIPVRGAIVLNQTLDKCVMVKGYGSKAGWGFPKGKINQNEKDHDCAVREVLEEIGFDITPYLKMNEYIEVHVSHTEQSIRLYVVTGVPEDTVFIPQTRHEISEVRWFPLVDLYAYAHLKKSGQLNYTSETDVSRSKIHVFMPIIIRLRGMVDKKKAQEAQATKNQRAQQPQYGYPMPAQNSPPSNQVPLSQGDMIRSMLGLSLQNSTIPNSTPPPRQAPPEPQELNPAETSRRALLGILQRPPAQ